MLQARGRFCGLPITLAPGRVFTPRPATERLVRAALARIDDEPKRVADVGTGSGAIAVALAVYRPQIEVWATDLSPDAIELAGRNTEECGVADRVHVLQGDLLEPIPVQLDVVVANLPYLPESLRDPRYDNEPDEAVYALRRDGLDPVRRLLDECCEGMLAVGGVVLIQLYGNVLAANRPQLEEAA
jgi:release factor glutamine methyltransferase